MQPSII